ncbi:MAG: hypothetical protein HKN12_10165, partial [Gemmatimonadetes bacterium]|nr:hypothetical protein [Gemmatimonadota bacterium]
MHAGDAANILTTDYWAGVEYADHTLYRPVTIATYALQHAVHGPDPAPYHVVNVLLHALVTLLLGWLVRDLFRNDAMAVIAATLFAVHPVHVEAVAGVVGRAEILALGGTLLATLAWFRAGSGHPRAWSAVAVAAYAVGAGSKETGVLAPAVILATEVLLPARRRLLPSRRPAGRRPPSGRPRDVLAVLTFAGFLAVGAAYLALRGAAVSGRSINAAMAALSTGERMLASLRILGENVGLLFVPTSLSADYPASSVAGGGVADPATLAGIV